MYSWVILLYSGNWQNIIKINYNKTIKKIFLKKAPLWEDKLPKAPSPGDSLSLVSRAQMDFCFCSLPQELLYEAQPIQLHHREQTTGHPAHNHFSGRYSKGRNQCPREDKLALRRGQESLCAGPRGYIKVPSWEREESRENQKPW